MRSKEFRARRKCYEKKKSWARGIRRRASRVRRPHSDSNHQVLIEGNAEAGPEGIHYKGPRLRIGKQKPRFWKMLVS